MTMPSSPKVTAAGEHSVTSTPRLVDITSMVDRPTEQVISSDYIRNEALPASLQKNQYGSGFSDSQNTIHTNCKQFQVGTEGTLSPKSVTANDGKSQSQTPLKKHRAVVVQFQREGAVQGQNVGAGSQNQKVNLPVETHDYQIRQTASNCSSQRRKTREGSRGSKDNNLDIQQSIELVNKHGNKHLILDRSSIDKLSDTHSATREKKESQSPPRGVKGQQIKPLARKQKDSSAVRTLKQKIFIVNLQKQNSVAPKCNFQAQLQKGSATRHQPYCNCQINPDQLLEAGNGAPSVIERIFSGKKPKTRSSSPFNQYISVSPQQAKGDLNEMNLTTEELFQIMVQKQNPLVLLKKKSSQHYSPVTPGFTMSNQRSPSTLRKTPQNKPTQIDVKIDVGRFKSHYASVTSSQYEQSQGQQKKVMQRPAQLDPAASTDIHHVETRVVDNVSHGPSNIFSPTTLKGGDFNRHNRSRDSISILSVTHNGSPYFKKSNCVANDKKVPVFSLPSNQEKLKSSTLNHQEVLQAVSYCLETSMKQTQQKSQPDLNNAGQQGPPSPKSNSSDGSILRPQGLNSEINATEATSNICKRKHLLASIDLKEKTANKMSDMQRQSVQQSSGSQGKDLSLLKRKQMQNQTSSQADIINVRASEQEIMPTEKAPNQQKRARLSTDQRKFDQPKVSPFSKKDGHQTTASHVSPVEESLQLTSSHEHLLLQQRLFILPQGSAFKKPGVPNLVSQNKSNTLSAAGSKDLKKSPFAAKDQARSLSPSNQQYLQVQPRVFNQQIITKEEDEPEQAMHDAGKQSPTRTHKHLKPTITTRNKRIQMQKMSGLHSINQRKRAQQMQTTTSPLTNCIDLYSPDLPMASTVGVSPINFVASQAQSPRLAGKSTVQSEMSSSISPVNPSQEMRQYLQGSNQDVDHLYSGTGTNEDVATPASPVTAKTDGNKIKIINQNLSHEVHTEQKQPTSPHTRVGSIGHHSRPTPAMKDTLKMVLQKTSLHNSLEATTSPLAHQNISLEAVNQSKTARGEEEDSTSVIEDLALGQHTTRGDAAEVFPNTSMSQGAMTKEIYEFQKSTLQEFEGQGNVQQQIQRKRQTAMVMMRGSKQRYARNANQPVWSKPEPVTQDQLSLSLQQDSQLDVESSYQTARLTPIELKLTNANEKSAFRPKLKVRTSVERQHREGVKQSLERKGSLSGVSQQKTRSIRNSQEIHTARCKQKSDEASPLCVQKPQQPKANIVVIQDNTRHPDVKLTATLSPQNLSPVNPKVVLSMSSATAESVLTKGTNKSHAERRAFLKSVYNNMQRINEGKKQIKKKSVAKRLYAKRKVAGNYFWDYREMKSKIHAFDELEEDREESCVLERASTLQIGSRQSTSIEPGPSTIANVSSAVNNKLNASVLSDVVVANQQAKQWQYALNSANESLLQSTLNSGLKQKSITLVTENSVAQTILNSDLAPVSDIQITSSLQKQNSSSPQHKAKNSPRKAITSNQNSSGVSRCAIDDTNLQSHISFKPLTQLGQPGLQASDKKPVSMVKEYPNLERQTSPTSSQQLKNFSRPSEMFSASTGSMAYLDHVRLRLKIKSQHVSQRARRRTILVNQQDQRLAGDSIASRNLPSKNHVVSSEQASITIPRTPVSLTQGSTRQNRLLHGAFITQPQSLDPNSQGQTAVQTPRIHGGDFASQADVPESFMQLVPKTARASCPEQEISGLSCNRFKSHRNSVGAKAGPVKLKDKPSQIQPQDSRLACVFDQVSTYKGQTTVPNSGSWRKQGQQPLSGGYLMRKCKDTREAGSLPPAAGSHVKNNFAFTQAKPSLFKPVQVEILAVDSYVKACQVANQIAKPGTAYNTTRSMVPFSDILPPAVDKVPHRRIISDLNMSSFGATEFDQSASVTQPLAVSQRNAFAFSTHVSEKNSILRRKAFSFTKQMHRKDVTAMAKGLNKVGKSAMSRDEIGLALTIQESRPLRIQKNL